jgi:hypothetical protein
MANRVEVTEADAKPIAQDHPSGAVQGLYPAKVGLIVALIGIRVHYTILISVRGW